MTYDARLTSFLGQGTAAARPASLTITPDAVGLWSSTDTGEIDWWDGNAASWKVLRGASGLWNAGTVNAVAGQHVVTSNTLTSQELANHQTGTSYTIVAGDLGKLITMSNTAAVALALPNANTLPSGFFFDLENINSGTVTVTPATSTVDGATSLVVGQNQGVKIVGDGTNYNTQRGMGSAAAGGVTSVVAGSGLSGGTITSSGTLAADWRGGTVTALGTHLSLSSGTLEAVNIWNAGTVTALGTHVTLSSGTLEAVNIWNAGTVTALGTHVTLTSGTLEAVNIWNAGTVSALGDGVALSSGTIQVDHQGTITATATGTISPTGIASCLINVGTVATTLTVSNGSYNGQHLRLEILQGATAHTVAFDASVAFGTDITSYTATTTASKRDLVQLVWNGTAWMFAAVNHGF